MKLHGVQYPSSFKATEPNPGASGPSVALEKANQATLPSLPLSRALPRASLGDSGTRTLHGIITEEYNSQLQGVQGIKVYDEMRKSDATVRAAIVACTLPILAATWFVNPATEDEKDKDIANFVEHALFDWLDLSWNDVVRQALLMIPFGVMPFEKVYGIKEHEGKDWVTLTKFAPRLPKSILQWELPDRTFGIQQIRQDGILAMIPGSKLAIFVNEREGDNWWGTSFLRAAYKHWYYKNAFYKIDAIAFERQGIGVPMIKMPTGYTAEDEAQAVKLAQNLRANEAAYAIIPQGYEAEFMDMGSHTTRDPQNSINHHNKEILQSVLAQFLELGSTKSGSGSHALSQDHSDLFLISLISIANSIAGVFNKDVIPELVDLNFNDVKVYPVLDSSGIKKVDIQAIGTAVSQLVTAGAIHPTNDDEQYLRAAMGLPPRTQEDIDAISEGEPSSEQQSDGMDIEGTGGDDVEESNDDVETAKAPKATDGKKTTDAAKSNDTKTKKAETKSAKPKAKPAKPEPAKREAHDHTAIPRQFSDGKGFQSWRELTFAEKKVSWKNIDDKLDQLEASLSKDALQALIKAKDSYMAKLHAAISRGDNKAIADLEIAFAAEYKAILKAAMKAAYEYGKNNVSTEIGVAVPANTAETLASIDLLADTLASKAAADIEARAKISAVNAMRQDKNVLQTAGAIDAAIQEAIEKTVENTAGVVIGQSINAGRNDVFARYKSDIHALQRSEILDKKTCDFCLSMDGVVVSLDDTWASTDVFHGSCRGIWVAIMKDEKNPPEITGVPDELGKYYNGSPNDLKQPRAPIVRPGSAAEAEVQRRKNASGKK